jgi:hypothetical protein
LKDKAGEWSWGWIAETSEFQVELEHCFVGTWCYFRAVGYYLFGLEGS